MTIEERNQIVTENLNLVYKAINLYGKQLLAMNHPLLSDDDLYQEGVTALMAAAGHYDASRGVAFSTYAVACIRRHFLRYYERVLSREAKADAKTTYIESEKLEESMAYAYYDKFDEVDRIQSIITTMDEIVECHKNHPLAGCMKSFMLMSYMGYQGKALKEKLELSDKEFISLRNLISHIRRLHPDKLQWARC